MQSPTTNEKIKSGIQYIRRHFLEPQIVNYLGNWLTMPDVYELCDKIDILILGFIDSKMMTNNGKQSARIESLHNANKGNKYCKACMNYKSVNDFYNDKTRTDSVSFYCKTCTKEYEKDYRNREYGRDHD